MNKAFEQMSNSERPSLKAVSPMIKGTQKKRIPEKHAVPGQQNGVKTVYNSFSPNNYRANHSAVVRQYLL